MPFTEFCIRSGGDNLNAGSLDGSTTECPAAPLAIYTGGDWDSATDIYTAPAGADLTEAIPGRQVSIYVDGDTSPGNANARWLSGKILTVNSGTRQIALDPTNFRLNNGTELASGTGNRSMRIAGAWATLSNGSLFPINQIWRLADTCSPPLRVNCKSDINQNHQGGASTMSANGVTIQGYTSSYGDGGYGQVTSTFNSVTMINASGTGCVFENMIFRETGTAGICFNLSGTGHYFHQCIFKDCQSSGVVGSGNNHFFSECEFFNCNTVNVASALGLSGSGNKIYRCMSHSNPNGTGIGVSGAQAGNSIEECVVFNNGRYGFGATSGSSTIFKNCDSYNNALSGFLIGSTQNQRAFVIENCNILKNGGWGIEYNGTHAALLRLVNVAYGAGTMANASGNFTNGGIANLRLLEIGTISYPSDVTPWNAPNSGDFRIVLAQAKNSGRGSFLQTAAGLSGTIGYPDRGAAAAAAAASGGSSIFSPFTQQVIG